MPESSQEKTEKATPKKREDARKKGQVLKSAEVNTAVMLLALFSILAVMGNSMVTSMREMLVDYLTVVTYDSVYDMSAARIHHLITDALTQIFKIAWPIFVVAVVAGLAVNIIQVGFRITGESIKPKFSRINPIEGFKRIFSMRTLVELLKSLLKIGVMGLVLYTEYLADLEFFENFIFAEISVTAGQMFDMCISLAYKACLVLVAIGMADYMYQWWEFEKNLKMTKQEIKDEYKMTEGDPLVKGAIKRRQREMSMRRMMSEIPKADVVITNPTHYAVAIQYKTEGMETPIVLAKGKDIVAQNIKKKAAEHKIPMVENRPVAQALYIGCEIGDEIPRELFAAVAEILAYVYKQKVK